ncbi:hypothetical protein [Falsiroseomonas oryzae]|uniref:hypothetical protein n=1 Tax=Falsiroseomonas oryzae TaxID=2766473 RepID=UPI0022EA8C55|nr:hypothetical protein [Roseomonas sp. MO-31]
MDEAGLGESRLIRPALGRTPWPAKAEALHGIARAMLAAEGANHRGVARRAAAAAFAAAERVVSDAPEWDRHCLDRLSEAVRLPRIGRIIGLSDATGAGIATGTGKAGSGPVMARRRQRARPDAERLRRRFLLLTCRRTSRS